jgi:hypothetical protein
MLSLSRLAVTASVAAALAVPAAAQARPDAGGVNWDDNVPVSIDRVSPDARLGEPDPNTTFVSVPKTEVVEADSGFEWGDAAIGGGAALLLTAVVGGAALTIRPRRAGALH